MPKTTKNRKTATQQPPQSAPEKERTLVSFDWAMKYILRDKANFDVLEGFLSTLLNRNITVIDLLESESNQKREDYKLNRVDLAVKDESDEQILIEIQHDLDIHHLKRLLFGTAKLITDHLKSGKPYAHIRKIISISILYFPMTDRAEDYIYHGLTEFYGWHTKRPMRRNLPEALQRKNQKKRQPDQLWPDKLWMENDAPSIFPEYYLIDVATFQNIVKEDIDEWLYLFKNSAIRQEFKSKNIQAAREKLAYMKMSEGEQLAYEHFMLQRATEESTLQSAHLSGVTAGERNQAFNMARTMLQHGESIEKILLYTGLIEAEILSLEEQH